MTSGGETTENKPTKTEYLGPQHLTYKPAGRQSMMLSADKAGASETARSFANYIASKGFLDDKSPDGGDILDRFKRMLADDILPAICADIVVQEILYRYGEEMNKNTQTVLQRVARAAVLSTAYHSRGEYRNESCHRRFENIKLHAINYEYLSENERKEYIREKMRRIQKEENVSRAFIRKIARSA